MSYPKFIYAIIGCCFIPFLYSCEAKDPQSESATESVLFTLLSPEETGVYFNDSLIEGVNTNILMYEYFYNGGGVAAGDLNGDGLDDLYFTANMKENSLYLNKGNLKFEDITKASGIVSREGPWKTGVSMADVNGDGLLDLYICYSGNLRPEKLISQLYINLGNDANGIPRFSDKTAEFGLNIPANTTQGYFFDFDRDGDLDLLQLNHNPRNLPILDEANTSVILGIEAPMYGLRLYQNNNNRFADITARAGISSSALSYGLGAGISDLNNDGWPDLYISNDYAVPDFLYLNNGNGTFTNQIESAMGHTSQFSMGNDISDINNDGLPDIITLDMLPEDNRRQKLLFAPDNYEKFDLNVRTGFYYQYMRNMLQMNNGDGSFSELGQLAGISNTDWSWAPLLADYDNDGLKDLFVTNGYVRDFTNMDFMKYMGGKLENRDKKILREDVLKLVHEIPASNVVNYIFKNENGLNFTNAGEKWGMNAPSNSNGAAYADLDNDGDLDLIISNINEPAFIYRNESDNIPDAHHFLRVKLNGVAANRFGLGARITVFNKGVNQMLEQMPARGFQSSVSPVLHFGLGKEKEIDSVRVVWNSGKHQTLKNVKAGQTITLQESDAKEIYLPAAYAKTMFSETASPVQFQHPVTRINDFKRQPLMVNPLSYSGPCMVKGDVNKDGLEDLFIGGGAGTPAALFLQRKGGSFLQQKLADFENDQISEDADAIFVDVNGDSFPDLYVASGGYHHFLPDDPALEDRLYLNDGKGGFTRSSSALPEMRVAKSCVSTADINGDGYADLFVGGRVIPGRYPEPPSSYILIGDGKGNFQDQTDKIAPELKQAGMVTAATWTDLNGDNKADLILAGEWMPITVLINENGVLNNRTSSYFDKEYRGWWNTLLVEDINGDGRPDLVAGNQGLNTQCRATDQEPAEMFFKDFDDNGSVDPLLCFYIQGKSYPYVTRDELLDQMSTMRTRYTSYASYADQTLSDIFSKEDLKGSTRLHANYLQTAMFTLDSNNRFVLQPLPVEAQYSPVFSITAFDWDADGKKDLLLTGNINRARLRFGKSDANYGVLLLNDGNGTFKYIPQFKSGLKLKGDVRSAQMLNGLLIFGINGQALKAYKRN